MIFLTDSLFLCFSRPHWQRIEKVIDQKNLNILSEKMFRLCCFLDNFDSMVILRNRNENLGKNKEMKAISSLNHFQKV